jgi:hypothetical protein
MKKFLFLALLLGIFAIESCDKVKNPFPSSKSIDLDTSIYPGSWKEYKAKEWPEFSLMPPENGRNALIEDYTGHNCNFCPAAAKIAHEIHETNPSDVFVASIHAANTADGMSSFQSLNISQGYTIKFYNNESLELGKYFGTILVNSGFFGNPSGTISRVSKNNEYFASANLWQGRVNEVLKSPLKIGIKAKVNYYETPKHGFILHTEVVKLDNSLNNELAMVVYMIEDSLVGPQNVSNVFTPDYVHRDIFRGTIDGRLWGRTLTSDLILNGKYYLDYSGIIPDQLVPEGATPTGHNAKNMHLLIYVYDKKTLEIYQVIKKKFVP